jgi:hypothetical protein
MHDTRRVATTATGIERLSGAVDRETAGAMADAVWASLAARGVVREDPTTWPSGFVTKNQALRKSRIFDGFASAATAAALDERLGRGGWRVLGPWGPALVTFPEAGPWTIPHRVWHLDVPATGHPDRPAALRLFGFVSEVGPRGGGTLVVEGSHAVVRAMVAAAPDHHVGSSADVRARLGREQPWFRALFREGGDRIRQFMVDGDEVLGVHVRVAELTGAPGDLAVMQPWTLHNLSMNCASTPRFMVTQTASRSAARPGQGEATS